MYSSDSQVFAQALELGDLLLEPGDLLLDLALLFGQAMLLACGLHAGVREQDKQQRSDRDHHLATGRRPGSAGWGKWARPSSRVPRHVPP